jgi:hypothetical protein
MAWCCLEVSICAIPLHPSIALEIADGRQKMPLYLMVLVPTGRWECTTSFSLTQVGSGVATSRISPECAVLHLPRRCAKRADRSDLDIRLAQVQNPPIASRHLGDRPSSPIRALPPPPIIQLYTPTPPSRAGYHRPQSYLRPHVLSQWRAIQLQ